MLYQMNLQNAPFAKIASGEKTIEMRLYDEKRRQLQVGDRIEFFNAAGEKLLTEITALHRFASFAELYRSLPLIRCGYCQQELSEAKPEDMEAYYPREKQEKYGVLGIEIRLL